MDYLASIDQMLERLEPGYYESSEDWAVRLLSATYYVNRAVADMPLDDEEGKGRLERWLRRLFDAVQKAAADYGAVSFSLSVGIPAGHGLRRVEHGRAFFLGRGVYRRTRPG